MVQRVVLLLVPWKARALLVALLLLLMMVMSLFLPLFLSLLSLSLETLKSKAFLPQKSYSDKQHCLRV